MQKEETQANSHVSEEITVTWKKGGRKGNGSKPFAEGRNQTGSCVATTVRSEQEKKGEQRHHARRYGEKLISRPDSLKRHREHHRGGPGVPGLVGEGAAQISSPSLPL